VPVPLDLGLLRQAMPCLIGRHDFRAFRDTGSCDRHSVRTLQRLSLSVNGPLITLQVQGDGFLYHMVRILAGTLLGVAQGKIRPEALPDILAGGDRKLAGKTLPAQGLCLERVLYDPPLFDDYFSQMAEEGEKDVQFAME
jgi:tRNA pseudouridine38-40 synthase